MSPEYVVKNDQRGRSEIEVNLLPGEDKKNLHAEIIAPHIVRSYLKNRRYGFPKAKQVLEEILPSKVAEGLLRAVVNGDEGAKVRFEKTSVGNYKVIETNLNFPGKKST